MKLPIALLALSLVACRPERCITDSSSRIRLLFECDRKTRFSETIDWNVACEERRRRGEACKYKATDSSAYFRCTAAMLPYCWDCSVSLFHYGWRCE